MYDYLIVGAGLFGAVFAREMKNKGVSCAVIDRRSHIAGNIYTEKRNGIHVHRYGAHIFHTSDKEVWEYVQQFAGITHSIYHVFRRKQVFFHRAGRIKARIRAAAPCYLSSFFSASALRSSFSL